MDEGATELDMVVNIGHAVGNDWDGVRADIGAVVKAAHAHGAIVKVIFENCYLNDEQKIKLCQICGDVNADYVKTSTGFGTGGATHADLILMRRSAPSHVKLKAAGGVRDLDGAASPSVLWDATASARVRRRRYSTPGANAWGWNRSRFHVEHTWTVIKGACEPGSRQHCAGLSIVSTLSVCPITSRSHRPMKIPVSKTPTIALRSAASRAGSGIAGKRQSMIRLPPSVW